MQTSENKLRLLFKAMTFPHRSHNMYFLATTSFNCLDQRVFVPPSAASYRLHTDTVTLHANDHKNTMGRSNALQLAGENHPIGCFQPCPYSNTCLGSNYVLKEAAAFPQMNPWISLIPRQPLIYRGQLGLLQPSRSSPVLQARDVSVGNGNVWCTKKKIRPCREQQEENQIGK